MATQSPHRAESATTFPFHAKRVLLTGGCGFIGSHLCDYLLAQPSVERLVVVDALTSGSVENIPDALGDPRTVLVAPGDYGDVPLIASLMDEHRIDVVLHLGGETHVDRSYADPIGCAATNVLHTVALLEACRHSPHLRRFLFMSTDEIYGDTHAEPRSEKDMPEPNNPYAASKAGAEYFVHSYRVSYGMPTVIVRSNNVYGPRQTDDKVVPRFVSLVAKGEPITIHGSGEQRRNWVHVRDTCGALWRVLSVGKVGEVYNIGSDDEVSILQLAHIIHARMKQLAPDADGDDAPRIAYESDRPHNDKHYHIDWTKIREELGWTPTIPFSVGMRDTVDAYALHGGPSASGFDRRAPCVAGCDASGNATGIAVSPESLRALGSGVRFLVYGHRGWIGGKATAILDAAGVAWVGAERRPGDDDDADVASEIDATRPTHVLCLVGRTSGPGFSSIDYLESGGPTMLRRNVGDNLYAPLLLALLCSSRGVHMTYLGTGCIFHYPDALDAAACREGPGQTESDRPNFFGSSYSVVKGFTDRIFHHIPVLNLRIRMPLGGEAHPKDFVHKIAHYRRVVNVPNSVTSLPELLPIAIDMALRRLVGTVNLVNPGVVSHNEVLDAYRELVDPSHVTVNMTLEEQAEVTLASRSNCKLATDLLESMYRVLPAAEAVRECVRMMSASVSSRREMSSPLSDGVAASPSDGVAASPSDGVAASLSSAEGKTPCADCLRA